MPKDIYNTALKTIGQGKEKGRKVAVTKQGKDPDLKVVNSKALDGTRLNGNPFHNDGDTADSLGHNIHYIGNVHTALSGNNEIALESRYRIIGT